MRRILTIGLAIVALGVTGMSLSATAAGAKKECTIQGTAADDNLIGTTRDDVICGRAGQDELFGREGNDLILGGQGDDQLSGEDGSDRLKGGPDDEIARCDGDRGGFQPQQCNGPRAILTTGGIEGGDQNDWMSGGQGDDDLFGNNGNDTLKTRDQVSGNDEANGGSNTDTCVIDAGDFNSSCER